MAVAYRELALGIAALLDKQLTALSGPLALEQLLLVGQRTLGVAGMAIAELNGQSGRVVAATGTASWALGRPVQPDAMRAACRSGDPLYRIDLGELDEESAEQLLMVGSRWIMVYRIDVQGGPKALLGAFITVAGDDADEHAGMALLGATLTRFYAEQAALPGQDPLSAVDRADRELFIAVTSHELRTPVTVIKGYADTLRDHWDRLDEETRRDAARVIGQRSDDLARLVDRLLAASTTAAMTTVSLVPFDLIEALRNAAENLPTDLRRRLRLDLPGQIPPALGDRSSVANILTELVTNAHKYSSGAEPVVLTAATDRRTVLFQVADRGIGIAPDQTHQVFERFWQGDAGDGRRYGGAGLGLYLVRKTIERQNGWVSLRPRDGGGTVAEVRLPRGDVRRDAAASGEA